jgi:hypothetical protein
VSSRLLAAVALGLGCTSVKPRPLPPAAEEVLSGAPAVTYAAALQAVTDLGLPLRFTDAGAGVVETDYVDVVTYQPEAAQYPVAERRVRFRIVATLHEAGPASRLSVFAVYSPFRTGLSDVRRSERAIPRDHPGMELVRRVVAEVRKSVERG